jgi:hypothetical protein
MRWQCQSAVVPSGGQTGDPTARKAWPPWWPAGLAWALWALTLAGLGGNFWFDQLPRQAGSFEVDRLNAAAYPVLLAAVSAATVGAVVASRRHRHPVGWLLLATGLTMVVDLGVNGYVRYGSWSGPARCPARATWPGSRSASSWSGSRSPDSWCCSPHRVAALAPVAVVGQGRGRRAGAGGVDAGVGARPVADAARCRAAGAGLVAWSILARIHLGAVRSRVGPYPAALAGRIVLAQLAVLPLLAAGVSLLVGAGGGLYWLAPGVVLCLVVTVLGAWVLLIEILRRAERALSSLRCQRPTQLSVTLPGRRPTTLAGESGGGRRCRDLFGPTGMATAMVGGRAGLGAVDPRRARPGRDRLVRPAAAPSRSA